MTSLRAIALRGVFLVGTVVALLLIFFFLFAKNEKKTPANPPVQHAGVIKTKKIQQDANQVEPSWRTERNAVEQMEMAISQALAELEDNLRKSPKKSNHRELKRLQEQLQSCSLDVATNAIISFLRSGRDSPTGLDFVVSDGGLLDSAPTLRTLLIDELAKIDPLTAASFASELLAGGCTPSESSLALRNLKWGTSQPNSEAFFREYTLRHLANNQWAELPEAGYLEGYDAAVELNEPIAVGILARRITEKPQSATANAAQLALERLVAGGNAEVMASITTSALPPQIKAELLARADMRDQKQRSVLEAFLLDSNQADVHQAFMAAFPLASHSSSPSLITEERLPSGSELIERDTAALKTTIDWINNSQFSSHHEQLGEVQKRLQEFLGATEVF